MTGQASHQRRSIRLDGHDYTQAGAYFLTFCCQGRVCLFGECVDGVMKLNPLGEIVQAEWLKTAVIRPEVDLDAFVVMPNHVHAIVVMPDTSRGAQPCAPTKPHLEPSASFFGGIGCRI